MQPELRLVRYFVAVAEERHFTRAAERLHMAQPPLSAAIRQLERQLGVALLDRSFRGVRLTGPGELFLERGRALLAEADDVVSSVRAAAGEVGGLLSVGITPAARHGIGPELLELWEEAAPTVMIHRREDTSGALTRAVRDGSLDLALLFCPPPLEGLAHQLARERAAVLHVRADHPLAARERITLADAREETFIVASGKTSPGYTAAVLRLCREAGFDPATFPDPYVDLGTRAVQEGLGVVLYVPDAFATDPPNATLLPVEPSVTLPFVLVWREPAGTTLELVLGALSAG
jgi:DNA-binding transcriptional LysR family regulator